MLRLLAALMICTLTWQALADETDIFGAKKSPKTELPGEYVGTYLGDNKEIQYGLQIFAMGDGRFRAVGYNGGLPGDGFQKGGKIERVEGKLEKNSQGNPDAETIVFKNGKEEATATVTHGNLVGRENDTVIARMRKIKRKNPITKFDSK